MPGRPVRAGGAGPGHRQRRDRDLDRAGPARRARDGQRPESGRAGRGRRQRLGTGGLGALCRRQLVRRRAGRRGLRADRLQPALRGQRRSAPATGRRALRAARRADRRRRRTGRPGPHRAGRRRAACRAARCGWSTAGTRPRRCAACSRRPASRTWQAAATWPASSAFPAAAGRAGASGSGRAAWARRACACSCRRPPARRPRSRRAEPR